MYHTEKRKRKKSGDTIMGNTLRATEDARFRVPTTTAFPVYHTRMAKIKRTYNERHGIVDRKTRENRYDAMVTFVHNCLADRDHFHEPCRGTDIRGMFTCDQWQASMANGRVIVGHDEDASDGSPRRFLLGKLICGVDTSNPGREMVMMVTTPLNFDVVYKEDDVNSKLISAWKNVFHHFRSFEEFRWDPQRANFVRFESQSVKYVCVPPIGCTRDDVAKRTKEYVISLARCSAIALMTTLKEIEDDNTTIKFIKVVFGGYPSYVVEEFNRYIAEMRLIMKAGIEVRSVVKTTIIHTVQYHLLEREPTDFGLVGMVLEVSPTAMETGQLIAGWDTWDTRLDPKPWWFVTTDEQMVRKHPFFMTTLLAWDARINATMWKHIIPLARPSAPKPPKWTPRIHNPVMNVVDLLRNMANDDDRRAEVVNKFTDSRLVAQRETLHKILFRGQPVKNVMDDVYQKLKETVPDESDRIYRSVLTRKLSDRFDPDTTSIVTLRMRFFHRKRRVQGLPLEVEEANQTMVHPYEP